MRSRRGILGALVLVAGLAGAALAPVAASAQVGTHRQSVRSATWGVPSAERPNGIGQWVYVAPVPAAGPDQLATTGYLYGPTFFPEASSGIIGVDRRSRPTTEAPSPGSRSTATSGPERARSTATIRYDWSPGKFYLPPRLPPRGQAVGRVGLRHTPRRRGRPSARCRPPQRTCSHILSCRSMYEAREEPRRLPFGAWRGSLSSSAAPSRESTPTSTRRSSIWGRRSRWPRLGVSYRLSGGDCPTEAHVGVRLGPRPAGGPAGMSRLHARSRRPRLPTSEG